MRTFSASLVVQWFGGEVVQEPGVYIQVQTNPNQQL